MKKGTLFLEDGSKFEGYSFGFDKTTSGEVVFNTGMIGYPETLTDPSYAGQILVLTYPLIGNYGVPSRNYFESGGIKVRGLIISDYSEKYSHWQAKKSLGEWLKEERISALCGVDTRALTKKLREKGVMLGGIDDKEFIDPNKNNLVVEVSVKKIIKYNQNRKKKIVVVDCGMKENILREFLRREVQVIRVPWNYDFDQINYDGLFLSNGPGDPKKCDILINNLVRALKKNKPIFGICLGLQMIALASGADTYKLKYGHRSQNQPCLLEGAKKCYLTSQNHGYAVRENSLNRNWQVWFRNLNDNTIEGIRHKFKPFTAVQFHPEAAPGPIDTNFLFDEFLKNV